MRYVVVAFSTALILALYIARPAIASGDDEVSKLRARIEKLEAEIKALKQQVARLTEQPATQKKPPIGIEVLINEADITIGEKKHTLVAAQTAGRLAAERSHRPEE